MRAQGAAVLGLIGALSPAQAFAERQLTLVEGSACAFLSHQIETQGVRNESILNNLGDAQVEAAANRSKKATADAAKAADRLAYHYEQVVALRKSWIDDYEQTCTLGRMSLTDLKRVCRTDSGAFDFSKTSFCKPLRDAGL
ncbi:MAG: hypothetical protein RIC52_02820 [Amphiplicatus sp.]